MQWGSRPLPSGLSSRLRVEMNHLCPAYFQLSAEETGPPGKDQSKARLRKSALADLLRVPDFVDATKAPREDRAVGKGNHRLAIYQLSVKAIRRSQGGNACAAAAYRSGAKVGRFDYSNRRGVVDRALFLPDQAPPWGRARLWPEAEAAERRKNSVVARRSC